MLKQRRSVLHCTLLKTAFGKKERKIKSTGLFSISDKKYLKCKKLKKNLKTRGNVEGTVPVTCKSSCCEFHYRLQLLPNSVETPRPLSIRLRGFLLQEVQFSCKQQGKLSKKGERGKCLKRIDEDYKFYCGKYLLPGFKNKDRRTTN